MAQVFQMIFALALEQAGQRGIPRGLVEIELEGSDIVVVLVLGLGGRGDRQGSAEAGVADVQPGIASHRIEIAGERSEEHTSELQSLMRSSYAVFCLKKKNKNKKHKK